MFLEPLPTVSLRLQNHRTSLSMKFCAVLICVALTATCWGQRAEVDASNERIRIREERRQLDDANWRRQQDERVNAMRQRGRDAAQNERITSLENAIEDAAYDYRYPTSEEVAAMKSKWTAEHPFTLSTEMPDFASSPIRVPKGQATTQYYSRPINTNDRAIRSTPRPAKRITPSTSKPPATAKERPAPRATNPNGVTMRKLSDGQVMAIIGTDMKRFKNEAEAQAYIERVKKGDPAR